MGVICCRRVRFKLPKEKADEILALIENRTEPDSIATGELAEGAEPAPGVEPVELLYRDPPDLAEIKTIIAACGVEPQDFIFDEIEETDWVTASLRDLKPVAAGRFLIHGSHCRPDQRPGLIPLEIDAGLAFGTGHHETTIGCLEAVSDLAKFFKWRNILDVGTGTGVLAMGALKLRPAPCILSDIDDIAVRVTKNNLRINRLKPAARTTVAAGVSKPLIQAGAPYDLVFANILARPLIGMAGDIAAVVARGGYLILSGLLTRQARRVTYAYTAQKLTFYRAKRYGAWTTLILRR